MGERWDAASPAYREHQLAQPIESFETRVMAWRSEPFFESDPSIVILRRFTEQLGLGDHISGNRRRHKFQAGPGSQERLRL